MWVKRIFLNWFFGCKTQNFSLLQLEITGVNMRRKTLINQLCCQYFISNEILSDSTLHNFEHLKIFKSLICMSWWRTGTKCFITVSNYAYWISKSFKIDFMRNPFSGSAALFIVIILKFIFAAIFKSLVIKKSLETKKYSLNPIVGTFVDQCFLKKKNQKNGSRVSIFRTLMVSGKTT